VSEEGKERGGREGGKKDRWEYGMQKNSLKMQHIWACRDCSPRHKFTQCVTPNLDFNVVIIFFNAKYLVQDRAILTTTDW